MSKYGNKRTVVDGITFDSNAEARRWIDLRLMEKAGEISGLERQVKIELVKGVRLHGSKRARPPMRLIVDFAYTQKGKQVWEDTKGMETPLSRAKRHMALALHHIDVRTTS